MRWEQLFADLAARFDELSDAEVLAELPDRQRQIAGEVTLVQRCVGSIGAVVTVRTRAGERHQGVLTEVGPDWLLIVDGMRPSTLIPLLAVAFIDGLGHMTGQPLGEVSRRFTCRLALRGLARDRSPVVVTLGGADEHGAGTKETVAGTIDRVGVDFVEIAQHPVWELRRREGVRSVALIAVECIDSVRSASAI